MAPKPKIVTGMVMSTNGVTLFFDTGMSEVFAADGWRTQEIINAILPGMTSPARRAEIDLDKFKIETQIAAVTNGAVKVKGDSLETKSGKQLPMAPVRQHVERALYQNATGFKNFMALFEQVKAGHKLEDLLTFMENSDLPIADDGRIIAYKRLDATKDEGVFVDCHTKKVRQRVGSIVEMPRDQVNADRYTHCASGLHICSRDYLSNFSGSALVMVKIAPQDVVSVPNDTKSKVRACRYQIVALVPPAIAREVSSKNSMMTSPEGKKLLAEIIAGHHADAVEVVTVGQNGAHAVALLAKPKAAKKTKVREIVAPEINPVTPKKVREAAKKVAPKTAAPAKKAAVKKAATPRPVKPSWKPDYIAKLNEAERLIGEGNMSLRDIAKEVGMDRESMSNNLRFRGVKLPAAPGK